jgi:hypothetical protein
MVIQGEEQKGGLIQLGNRKCREINVCTKESHEPIHVVHSSVKLFTRGVSADLSAHNGLVVRADGEDLKGYIFDTEKVIKDWSFEIFNLHNEIYRLTGLCMVVNPN